MNLSKSSEFFNPSMIQHSIHIIGCGAVGSTLAENLVRLGLTRFTLWDFDQVESKNIVNQMFFSDQIGMNKVDAVADTMKRINPDVAVTIKPDGYHDEQLSGWVFLCVDNIDLRRKIAMSHRGSPFVKAMFDCRLGLTDGQHFAAKWSEPDQVKAFIDSMQFSHEEAMAQTPMSACRTVLSVPSTVRVTVALCVSNFMNMVRCADYHKSIMCDAFAPYIDAYQA